MQIASRIYSMKLLKYAVQYFHACRNIHTEHPRPRLAGAGRFQLSTVILFLFFFFVSSAYKPKMQAQGRLKFLTNNNDIIKRMARHRLGSM